MRILGSLLCVLLLWGPPAAAAVTDSRSGQSEERSFSAAADAPSSAKGPGAAHVQPDAAAHMLSNGVPGPNDPQRPKQTYLDQIGAAGAWKTVTEGKGITIALIDTGIDLDHPDLKSNLVGGVNLIRPGSAPEDDNGHGTKVAGVLAAVGNNGTGTTGILWKAKIMPIKALDREGSGDEEKLGEAVLYAVRHGAKIILLSVGLYRHSPYLQEIAAYAEKQGVLLVAASGNDGQLYGSKAEVTYPAAYPTVLAVGGVKPDGKPDPRSNPGTEIDVAAPWNVFTTAIGGAYEAEQGTSMAAPQAAAAAAMVWSMHPGWKPFQIREILRRTAKDVGPAGWDAATGYGLLQADKAIAASWAPESPEAGGEPAVAKRLPLFRKLAGSLNGGDDRDWYMIDAPYDGTAVLHFQAILPMGSTMPPVRITYPDDAAGERTLDVKVGSKTVDWTVRKGKSYFGLQLTDRKKQAELPYLLTADFRIAGDKYEPNETASDAFALEARTQTVAGTFHRDGDMDWYAVTFSREGTLKLSVDADSVRIDPGLLWQKQGGKLTEVDENGEGQTERSPVIAVTPGKYRIGVRNAAGDKASAAAATYKLAMSWVTRYDDPNEPNNAAYAATVLNPGTRSSGLIGRKGDTDWYRFSAAGKGVRTIKLENVPKAAGLVADVYDNRMKQLHTIQAKAGETSATVNMAVERGDYYIKVRSSVPFDDSYYRISVHDGAASGKKA